MFTTVSKIHFVGIGGIGMSGIAEILLSQGFEISGSDLTPSENTEYLKSLGARVVIGHSEDNIASAEVVVYSSAVRPEDNPETAAALRKGIPVIRRAEMLAEVARLNYSLAVSGTHGKTTTTSMMGLLLIKGGFDPTVIVGGRLKDFGGTNARLGEGEWTVVEADEFDRSFLQLTPTIAVINNIEPEHLDIYKDFDDLKDSFVRFASQVPFYGIVVVGLDDPGVKEILSRINKKVVTFGMSPHCDVRAEEISLNESVTECTIFHGRERLGRLRINVPGEHNLKNALASVAVGLQLDMDFDTIAAALGEFTGIYRRFDIKGEHRGIMVVDDYAHHPSEVKATLDAARRAWKRRIVCVFQPHTFTRTRDFYRDFGRSFDSADVLVVTDVYPAREKPIEGVDGRLIADAAAGYGHRNVNYVPDFDRLTGEVLPMLEEGDMVITLGAGSIWRIAEEINNELK
ncbi:MAG: UDP-N-acetylmuramate--L-alanine ligase [Candidatus Kapaibacterium sp.]